MKIGLLCHASLGGSSRVATGLAAALADLMLITSRYESFCLAALEALACGVPVLATKVGGLPEVIVDGQSSLLFQYGDEAAGMRHALAL